MLRKKNHPAAVNMWWPWDRPEPAEFWTYASVWVDADQGRAAGIVRMVPDWTSHFPQYGIALCQTGQLIAVPVAAVSLRPLVLFSVAEQAWWKIRRSSAAKKLPDGTWLVGCFICGEHEVMHEDNTEPDMIERGWAHLRQQHTDDPWKGSR